MTGHVVRSRLVEVKTGNAKFSKLQRKTGPKKVHMDTYSFRTPKSSEKRFGFGRTPDKTRKRKGSYMDVGDFSAYL